ncbi:MAG: aldose epimerase family protein [Lentisphaeria bacterium]
MSIKTSNFGVTKKGQTIKQFTISNGNVEVDLISFGACIRSIRTKNKNQSMTDVVLGFDSIEEYELNNPYLGVTVGRFCNRIAKGKFSINDACYTLPINNGVNSLHGGIVGFSHRPWFAEVISENSVRMIYVSKDGEEGYPGELTVEVVFTLTQENAIEISYSAKTDKDTVINLTNHTYFNLDGHGLILEHWLKLNSGCFLPTDESNIPTGELRNVLDTPFDFTEYRTLGERINENYEQLTVGSGYDHTYITSTDITIPAAEAYSINSGIKLTVYTTEPGVQLYTGNWLQDIPGKNGMSYANRSGFCLETQHWPDSPNQPTFPTTLLKAGETFSSKTAYKFDLM